MNAASTVPAVETIRTPDQRLRVFVSSTLGELAAERRAARRAIERLCLAPVLFEFGARPHPPRTLYRAYLEQSDVFVGIYWQSYGWVAPEMEVSGIEDEYLLSAGKPCLLYLRAPAPGRDPRLAAMIARLEADDRLSYKHFESADELEGLIAQDLALLLTEHFEVTRAVGGPTAPRPLPVPPTRLVGREDDVTAICDLLDDEDVRLVTLTGVGGIGKTRLALEVAKRTQPRSADGAHFVDLATVTRPQLVPTAVGAVLDVPKEGTRPATASIVDRLAGSDALLVLDNFEQLLEAAPFVAEVLTGCPTVRVLVTSRALLHLRGEHEYRVPPLGLPREGEESRLDEVRRSAAVRLFLERAQEAHPGFALTLDNATPVTEICKRLDGIPLALELAAVRLRLLTPQALVDRLGGCLDLLAGPADLPQRQRTLRATIEWSYHLLDEGCRRALDRLSVFPGGFTLEAAQAVCSDDEHEDVLDVLSSLVDQSLLAVQDLPGPEPRLRMPETVRHYGFERLTLRGEVDEAQRRMDRYVVDFGERAWAGVMSPQHERWMALIDAEVDNIRAVIDRAIERTDIATALRVAMYFSIYWWVRGLVAERRDAVEFLYSLDPPLSTELRALLLWGVGTARFITGDREAALGPLRDLLPVEEERGDPHDLAMARAMLGIALPYEPDGEGRTLLETAVHTFREIGDRWGVAWAVTHLGEMAMLDGDLDTAVALHREALEDARAVGSTQMEAQALNQLGLDALAGGDVDTARARYGKSAELLLTIRSREGLAYCLDGLAGVALGRGRARDAAVMLGASRAIREEIGVGVWPLLVSWTDKLQADVRAALGDETFDEARREGAGPRTEEAVRLALAATAEGEPETL
jgi:predicted ATPase